MTPPPEASPPSPGTNAKPRASIFLATACGLGYLPKAPGTFGAIGGLVVTVIPFLICVQLSNFDRIAGPDDYLPMQILIGAVVALVGVWTAVRAAALWQT